MSTSRVASACGRGEPPARFPAAAGQGGPLRELLPQGLPPVRAARASGSATRCTSGPGSRRGLALVHPVRRRAAAGREGDAAPTCGRATDEYIHIGEARGSGRHGTGSAEGRGRGASWDLALRLRRGAAVPPARATGCTARRVPRTKLLSPYPDARFSGRASFGDREVELDGWRGMVGHNWGAQHAERWIWTARHGLRGGPDAWFDGALGRIKLGPVTTPWIANGVLSLDGERHRLGGPGRRAAPRCASAPTARLHAARRGHHRAGHGRRRRARRSSAGSTPTPTARSTTP